MALPFFYDANIRTGSADHLLSEETSKHIVQVLRMRPADKLNITDGKGTLYLARLSADNKKKAAVKIISSTFTAPAKRKISIAISLLKNTSRFEWFLEKATEIGIAQIIPLLCKRTEKQHFRFNRMQAIVVSAMLQSQQSWLPMLNEPIEFTALFKDQRGGPEKRFIAHCAVDKNKSPLLLTNAASSALMLIGPEGDFTAEEISLATDNGCTPVTLGETRLRTETAGIVAAILLCNA